MSSWWTVAVLLLILAVFHLNDVISQDNKKYSSAVIKVTSLVCKSDPDMAIISKCIIEPMTREMNGITITIDLKKKFVDNVTVSFQIFRWSGNGWHKFLYEGNHIDACKFLKSDGKTHMVLGLMYEILKPASNLNHSCPLEGQMIVERLSFDPRDKKVNFVPLGRYAYNIDFFHYKKSVFAVNGSGVFTDYTRDW